MDPSFSQHRDHVPYPYNQYPSWEGRPPQVRLEPPKQPLYFGPCPFDGSTSQLNPADFNLCGSHGYPPGYYSYRPPPYSHFQPPSQVYYHGPYPCYPDAYPAYFVPPSHHPVDQARYNYERGKRHLCGCPNHVCHGGYDNSVKIEEQKPEIEQNNNDSSGLIRFPNYPYPVVWVPPGYIKDSKRTSEAQPEPSSRWIPLGMDNLKGLRSGEHEVGCLKSGQKVAPSPWPIIWIPGHGKAEEEIKDSKELKAKPEIREEVSSPKVKIVPLTYVDDEKLEKPGGIKDQNESCLHWEATKEKEGNTKSIPVIQKKEDEGKKYGKFGMNDTQEKNRIESMATIPDKKEDSGASSRIKQSSPDKSSKLPPVCLRVDPLPKKSANGSSRSPTLPSRAQQNNKEQLPCQKGANKEIPNKEICIVDVKDRPLSQIEKKVNQKTIPVVYLKGSSENMEEVSQNKDEQKAKGVERKASEDGKLNEGAHILEENKAGKEFSGGRKVGRKTHLSESDAAVLIQAAYRGYQVRKWQPLEKLRKIMHINEQVQNVRRQIQSFEVSPERQEMKQQMVFGETIMNLLLQLDAIQGLHSSVREARKSVARELIHLQENLDCLARESISEHKSATSRELVTDRNLEEQASAASIPPSSGPASDQLQIVKAADGNHATVPAYSDKIEVDASVSHLEMGAEGEENISTSGVFTECRDGIVSPACRDHKEAPDGGEGVESELVSEESAFRLDEAINPSVGTEMQDVPSVNRDGILSPEGEEQGKAEGASIGEQPQEVASAYRDVALSPKVEERGGMEVISSVEEQVSGSHTSTKCNQDLEESSEVLVVGRCLEKAAESDLASNDMKMVEPQSGEEASDSGVALCTLADTNRSLEQSSENGNLDAVIKVRETMASNSAVPAELSPVELIPDSDVVPHLADDKQEDTQMMPLAEESCCAENDAIIVDSTCDAVSVCLEAGSETLTSEDVVKVEKNLEMKESNDVVKPDKNFNVQESTDLGRTEDASEVIESNNMRNLVETPVEPCFGKVEDSTVEQDRLHLEDSLCNHTSEAAFKEVDTEGTKEMEGEFSHHNISTPSISLASLDNLSKKEKKLMEDNKKLRATLQELLEAGNQQLAIISGLDERVKDLERRLAHKKRVKIMRHKPKKST